MTELYVPKKQCFIETRNKILRIIDFIRILYTVIAFSELEPIPLTPEILEKNGFIKERLYCHGTPLQYCVLVDGLWIDISGENYFEGKLEYVHQLQHTIRLCGIEKEITL
jgi:hypothetical protein